MSNFQAIILGIVQGATEFLPISSSGHLIIVPWLMNWHYFLDHPDVNKTFDVALHVGTFVALMVYFWREVLHLLRAFFRSLLRRRATSDEERLAWLLLLSTIPAGIAGVLLEDIVVETLGAPYLIAILTIAGGAVFWVVDRYARLSRGMTDLRWYDSLIIGAAQAIALAPGVSRSGITMITGLILGLDRDAAARYSFLMSIPIIGGAALFKGVEVVRDGLPAGTQVPFALGTLSAAASGFVAVWWLLAYLRRHTFLPFVIYRFAVGGAMLLLIVFGVRGATGI